MDIQHGISMKSIETYSTLILLSSVRLEWDSVVVMVEGVGVIYTNMLVAAVPSVLRETLSSCSPAIL